MEGLVVEKLLKEKLWSSSNIVGMSAADIRTTICQNKCSDHGVCNSQTRACMCETFWMPSLYYFWGNGQANCGKAFFCVIFQKYFLSVFFFSPLHRLVHFICCDCHIYFIYIDIEPLLGYELFLSYLEATDSIKNAAICAA